MKTFKELFKMAKRLLKGLELSEEDLQKPIEKVKLKLVKERKGSSRPTRIHKPKKGKGSYKRDKKIKV